MICMRENRHFGERTRALSSSEAVKKYFLAFEGEKSEFIYFQNLNNLREQIGIDPIIEFVPLMKSYGEENWSNPKKIIDRVIKNLYENKSGKITYETILNRFMVIYGESRKVKNKNLNTQIWNSLKEICCNDFGCLIEDEVENIEKCCEELLKKLEKNYNFVIDNLVIMIETLKKSDINYVEDFDKICLIVDRDRESFTTLQYIHVLEQCQKYKFGFYVSNPCFEFWLLLHFDEVRNLNEEELLENAQVSNKKSYLEKHLTKFMGAYRKNKYDANSLIKSIDKAIQNEKSYCEDIEQLESSLGCNLGLLIEEIRK